MTFSFTYTRTKYVDHSRLFKRSLAHKNKIWCEKVKFNPTQGLKLHPVAAKNTSLLNYKINEFFNVDKSKKKGGESDR